MTDLQALLDEYASVGIGPSLDAEIRRAAEVTIRTQRFPPSFSPFGRWDAETIADLAQEWTTERLLRLGHLDMLLLTNTSLVGLRKGLTLSFRHFVLSQRQRGAADNLFHRAAEAFERDDRFRLTANAKTRAHQVWGLRAWPESRPQFEGSEDVLLAAGWQIAEFSAIRYGEHARKSSPILSNADLPRFLERLLQEVGAPLSLTQIIFVMRYRFNLLEADHRSLDQPSGRDQSDERPPLSAGIAANDNVEQEVVVRELALAVIKDMPPRRRAVIVAANEPGMTLARIAERLDCSRGTVDNEIRRTIASIAGQADGEQEAGAIYRSVVELLSLDSP